MVMGKGPRLLRESPPTGNGPRLSGPALHPDTEWDPNIE
jgi:hypothetical protein